MNKSLSPKIIILDFLNYYDLKSTSYRIKKIPFEDIFKRKDELNSQKYSSYIKKITEINIENHLSDIKVGNNINIYKIILENKCIIYDLISTLRIDKLFNVERDNYNFNKYISNFDLIFNEYLNTLNKYNYLQGFVLSSFYFKTNKIASINFILSEYYNRLKNNNNFFSVIKNDLLIIERDKILSDLNNSLSNDVYQFFGDIVYFDNKVVFRIDLSKSYDYFIEIFYRLRNLHFSLDSELRENILYLKYIIINDIINENDKVLNNDAENPFDELDEFKNIHNGFVNYLSGYFEDYEINIILNTISKNKFSNLNIPYIDLSKLGKPHLYRYLYFFKIISYHNNTNPKLMFNTISDFREIDEYYDLNLNDSYYSEFQKFYSFQDGLIDNPKANAFGPNAVKKFIKDLKSYGFTNIILEVK